MASSDYILQLVRQALDDFDDKPLDVSVRRAVRIANLVGDTKYAVRLALELRPMGGDRTTNGETSRMLMADPSTWGSGTGPAEQAHRQWMNDRQIGESGNVDVHSLVELEFWNKELDELKKSGERVDYDHDLTTRQRSTRIIARARHLTFALLCSWERRLGYTSINESIFGGYRVKVDKLLTDGVPELLQQFNAVYRRLQEAAETFPDHSELPLPGHEFARRINALLAAVDRPHTWHRTPNDPIPHPRGSSSSESVERAYLQKFPEQLGTARR
ncbi:hypothetical protein [Streptomyces mirabilis]|uniref:hypothetical protein n=1 Tax=Streptomyces mirabilis TaxID=68239 RepID=UPI0036BF4DD7